MTVKKLRELLIDVPDDLEVAVCVDGETFIYPSSDESGLMELGYPCDMDGNPVPEMDFFPKKLFGIIAPFEES